MLGMIFSVLLTILKVIMIILLSVIGLAVIALACVLFIPVRYRGKGFFDSEQMEGQVLLKVTWFLHAVSIKIWFEDKKVQFIGKIFGIKLFDSKKEKRKRVKKKKKDDFNQEFPEENFQCDVSGKDNDEIYDVSKNEKPDEIPEKPPEITNKTDKKSDDKSAEKSFFSKLNEKFSNIKFKFTTICDKIKNVNGVKESYIDFLSTEESKETIRFVKRRLFKVFKHIRPVKLKLEMVYGLPDPAATGNVYGLFSILFVGYGENVNITPEFEDIEKSFLRVRFHFRGRIRLFVLLNNGLKLFFNKRLREFITFIKN